MSEAQQQRRVILFWGILVEGALAVLAVGLGWWLFEPPWNAMRWDLSDMLLGTLAALPMLLGLIIGMRWPMGPMRQIRQINDDFIRPLFQPCSILELGLLSILAGVGEEWLFRGFLQGGCSEWLNPWWGWIIANVVFGLLHALTPTYAIWAASVGVYFGVLWVVTDNLLTPIVAHAVYDWLALIYLTRWKV